MSPACKGKLTRGTLHLRWGTGGAVELVAGPLVIAGQSTARLVIIYTHSKNNTIRKK